MKFLNLGFIIVFLSACSSKPLLPSQQREPAAQGTSLLCISRDEAIRVEIAEAGLGPEGRKFHGRIWNGQNLVRDDEMKRTSDNNEFGTQALDRAWSFFFLENGNGLISEMTDSLRKQIGPVVIVDCNKRPPNAWF